MESEKAQGVRGSAFEKPTRTYAHARARRKSMARKQRDRRKQREKMLALWRKLTGHMTGKR